MQVRETDMKGLLELFPTVFEDDRGYFLEVYHKEKLTELGIDFDFLQTNQSFSKKSVLRGLHFQNAPFAQGKLVRVISGKVLDVVVDIRADSASFGKSMKVILDGKKGNMLYVPEGFAHGFLALEDTHFAYHCTNVYHKASESGIIWNDPDLNIEWELEKYEVSQPIVSEKDKQLPKFEEIRQHL